MLPLMVAGQTLSMRAIKNVLARGIKGLYIEFEMSDDVVCDPLLPPEQKQEALYDIKTQFNKLTARNKDPDYKTFTKMAESIVMNILDRDQLLCDVMDIRSYDDYTYSHSLYVGMISVVLGANLKMSPSQLMDLGTAGLLHDIGKLEIAPEIVNKAGPLTPEEFEVMMQHPQRAVARMRKMAGCRSSILQGVASHHEHYDGTGYPNGVSGENIPLYGRILAVADVYDALSSNRSYRSAWEPSQIIDYITSRSGTQFDPDLLASFLRSVTAYPAGTLVILSDGSTALVLKNHPDFILRPTVRVLIPSELLYKEIDLSIEAFSTTIIGVIKDPQQVMQLIQLDAKRCSI